MKKFKKEAVIGLITIIGGALLYFGFNFLKGINVLNPQNHYYIDLANVRAVEVATPIFIDGFKVGLVRSVEYNFEDNKDMITVQIDLNTQLRLPEGSYAEIEESFLSGASIHIHLNKYTDQYLSPGDYLEGRRKPEMMAELSNNLLPSVVGLLPKIDSLLLALNSVVADPALKASLKNLETTTEQLSRSSVELNKVMSHQVPVILGDAEKMVSNLNLITTNLSKVDFQSTFVNLDHTVENFYAVSSKMNQTDNSLGLLLNDKELYQNLTMTVESANNLLIDLKQNPKRYINIKLF